MKATAMLAIFATLQFAGCVVSGGIEYEDPARPGVKANVGWSHEIKQRPRTDKNVVELEYPHN